MARSKSEKRPELEAFWRHHHDEWQKSTLNQREYCELHGLPLKRFGNWRAQFTNEATVARGRLLYRRGGLGHMPSHMSDRETGPISPGYIPSARAAPEVRRNFSDADKKQIVAEAMRAGSSISSVARRYGIGARLLFRWKQELSAPTADAPVFVSVTVDDGVAAPAAALPSPTPVAPPVIVERSSPEIEVELRGGRRVRFARDVDPETVRSLVTLLEGAGS